MGKQTSVSLDKLEKTILFHRKRSGLSRENLAKLAGVGVSTIYHLEKGDQGVGLHSLEKICLALNITILLSSPIMHLLDKERR